MSSDLQLGLCLDGTKPMAEAVWAAQTAESAGFESVWISDQVGYRDAVSTAAAVLGATRRLRVVPMALSPFTRHPMTIAMAIGALAEWAPGRVAVALGMGSPAALASLGIIPNRPAARLRHAAGAVQSWLLGLTPEGMPPLRYRPRSPVPVYLAATRPGMLRAAAHFDGVVLSGGLSPEAIRWSREQVDPPGKTEVVGMILVAMPDGARSADTVLREALARLIVSPHHQAVLRATEPHLDLAPILDAMAAGDVQLAGRILPAELIRSHGLILQQQPAEGLAAYRSSGIDLPVLWPVGGVGDWQWLAHLS